MRARGRFSQRPCLLALACLISACGAPIASRTEGGSPSGSAVVSPGPSASPAATYDLGPAPMANRDNGQVASTLVASYVFLQFDHISVADLEKNAGTIKALFIRSALMSFVDYRKGRVLGWDGRSITFPLDVRGFVRACNERNIPIFLEINYSDYVPGKVGTGRESLVKTDNLANTIAYLGDLAAQGLHVDGVTFGDEWGDDNGFGSVKPTLANSDIVGRFIAYATALKSHYPTLKIYAFDSSIGAASGELAQYWDPMTRIHEAELAAGVNLLDGFAFRESYVYMNAAGRVQPSQQILDDTESLYRDVPVYRYDTDGSTGSNPDSDYLHTLLAKTQQTFGRLIDIALTEYLPAGPVQISESDTSRYADIDFILHYADVLGIYGQLGLDAVSTFTFANSPQQNKAYLDRFGRQGPNYPVRAQVARYLTGQMLAVTSSVDYEALKVKVYAFESAGGYFVMILNKDASAGHVVRLRLTGQLDLTLRLPARSYASLIVDDHGVVVSGLGGQAW